MKIYRARYAGVCFGVKRAIKMALEAAQKWKRVYSLGPLIHNRLAVENLQKKGIITVDHINEIKNKKVIIRSHGAHPDVLKKLYSDGFEIVDATCPRVRRAQRYVEKLIEEGYFVIIIGEKDHPEVKGLLGYGGDRAEIYSEHVKIRKRKIGVVPQTTLDLEHLNEVISNLMSNAKKADAMIVIGGKNSANTTRLYQMCKKYKPSYHIESVDEIDINWFKGVESVGVTAGASTPKEQVGEVIAYIKKNVPG